MCELGDHKGPTARSALAISSTLLLSSLLFSSPLFSSPLFSFPLLGLVPWLLPWGANKRVKTGSRRCRFQMPVASVCRGERSMHCFEEEKKWKFKQSNTTRDIPPKLACLLNLTSKNGQMETERERQRGRKGDRQTDRQTVRGRE